MNKHVSISGLVGVFVTCLGLVFVLYSLSSEAVEMAPFEIGEDLPGGLSTSRGSINNRNAFSHSSGNMNFKKELDFKLGNALFRKLWVSSPASTKSSDGLGPLFNARSCQRCHLKDGRGHTPKANWPEDSQVSMFLRLSIPPQTEKQKQLLASHKANVIPEPTYGGQLQDLAIQGHDGEGRMHISYSEKQVTLKGGEVVSLRVPHYKITDLAYGPLHKKTMISPRMTPQMIGLGLLEAIPSDDILAKVDEQDKDGDGISGKANLVWSMVLNKPTLGRFGLKAGAPSVLEQSAGAFVGDIGISSHLANTPSGDCTAKQSFCLKAPNGNSKKEGTEISKELLDLVVFYARNLAVPKRRDAKSPTILKGKALFHKIGCASCHTPSFTTGKSPGNPHLEGQKIWPYTDLLLHDMGEGLADNRPEGRANGREWRTAPLWGVGLTPTINKHQFMLHDGRARGVKEAILWHGGEAQKSRDAFTNLDPQERQWLIDFVNSL